MGQFSKLLLAFDKVLTVPQRALDCRQCAYQIFTRSATPIILYTFQGHSRDTRAAPRSDLSLTSGKHKDIYINSFAYSGANIWNDIPTNIRNSVSLEMFQRGLLKKIF